jgi:sugar phosphate isomerase/epimerase
MLHIIEDVGLRVTDIEACGDWVPQPDSPVDVPTSFRSIWTRHDFFDAAEALGADTLVAADLGGGAPIGAAAVEGFAKLCDDAGERGLRVALEFMPFSRIPDIAAGWSTVQEADCPNGGLVLDLCHLVRGGWEPETLLSIPPDRIFAVQLGDGPEEAPDDLRDEAMFHRALPGEGSFDISGLLATLEGSESARGSDPSSTDGNGPTGRP